MDTDSAYIAFSGEKFEDLIKQLLKDDYNRIIYKVNLNGFQEMAQKNMLNLMKERLDYSKKNIEVNQ
jgi:hypothetical protein